MKQKTCSIGEYKSLPANYRISAIFLGRNSARVTSANEALRFVCEAYIRSGILTPSRVRSLGFSWIGLYPQTMRCARELGHGLYLAEDGRGSTGFLRITLLLNRLQIPLDYCTIDYEETDQPVAQESDVIQSVLEHLSYWDEREDEPANAVQKRIHEFSDEEKWTFIPYKVAIGGARFAISTWSDFANTFIAYVYTHFGKNGPRRLLDLQYSPHWDHGIIVKVIDGNITMIPVSKRIDGIAACELVSDLMTGLGFDRYSVYLKGVSIEGSPVAANDEGPDSLSSELMKMFSDDIPTGIIDPIGWAELCADVENKSTGGDSLEEFEPVTISQGRHLRPHFRILG